MPARRTLTKAQLGRRVGRDFSMGIRWPSETWNAFTLGSFLGMILAGLGRAGFGAGCTSVIEERFGAEYLSAQADAFAGSEREEKASACFARNDSDLRPSR